MRSDPDAALSGKRDAAGRLPRDYAPLGAPPPPAVASSADEEESEDAPKFVFLGGVCGATTWRQDMAVPRLREAGVTFFNPQKGVGEWTEAFVKVEADAKLKSRVLLFHISGETRSTASCIEAAEFFTAADALRAQGKAAQHVVLVVNEISPESVAGGLVVTEDECKDLNRARAYLREAATRRSAR